MLLNLILLLKEIVGMSKLFLPGGILLAYAKSLISHIDGTLPCSYLLWQVLGQILVIISFTVTIAVHGLLV